MSGEREVMGIGQSVLPTNWTAVGWLWFAVGVVGLLLHPSNSVIFLPVLLFPPVIRWCKNRPAGILKQWGFCLVLFLVLFVPFVSFQPVDQMTPPAGTTAGEVHAVGSVAHR